MKVPHSKLNRTLLFLAVVFVLLLVGDLALVRSRRHVPIAYDTTRATGPIGVDGTIDYVAAVDAEFSRGVTERHCPRNYETKLPIVCICAHRRRTGHT
jgi:hypothetical protein